MTNHFSENTACFRPSAVAAWFMDQLLSFPRFSHHPPCSCYDNHVLRAGRLVFCLGCTCMVIGGSIVAAFMIWMLVADRLGVGWRNSWMTLGWGVGLYGPTLAQPFCQWKPYKIVARTLLGGSVALLGFGGLLLPPLTAVGVLARSGFLAAFWVVLKATLRQRARYTPDPCSRCASPGYPFCQGNRPRIDALLEELRRRAGPEDAPFVAFATALSGETFPGISVEFQSLDVTKLSFAGQPTPACHGGACRYPSGSSSPS